MTPWARSEGNVAKVADIVEVAQSVLRLFVTDDGEAAIDEPWARSNDAFEEHFGARYEDFASKIPLLSGDQGRKYEATLKVNPEAAVLWVITMNETNTTFAIDR